jgi:hypothetical protein
MTRYAPYLLFGAALLGLIAGCHHHERQNGAGQTMPPTLPPASRDTIRAELDQMAVAATCPAPPIDWPRDYRAITEAEAQCLASANSSKANYLDQEAEALDATRTCTVVGILTHSKENIALQKEVLYYSALEDRNQSAGLALEQYFRVAENEAKLDLLRASLAALERTQKDVAILKERGMKLPAELETLDDQKDQLLADVTRLQNNISNLNDNLARLAGLDGCGRCYRLRPVLDQGPVAPPPDLDAALAVARAHRPSLLLSRAMEGQQNRHTLPAMKFFMQSTSGVLGSGGSPGDQTLLGKILGLSPRSDRRELTARKSQMERVTSETERVVHEEVCQAIRNLRVQAELVCATRERLKGQMERVRDLESKVARGLLSTADVLAPRLRAHRLEADLLHEVADWHIARIRLKQAQGLLIAECPQACKGCK